MKKQILTLAMCVAFSATAALAATPATVKKAPAKAPTHVVKVSAKTPAVKKAEPEKVVLTPEQEAKKRFEEKMAKDREDLYCKLNLTADQKAKAEAMDKKARDEAQPLFEKVQTERAKLQQLKANKSCPIEISKQRRQVIAAKKAVKAHFEASRKNFEAILTQEQKAKLEVIKQERRAEMQKRAECGCKCHKHHRPCGPCKPGFEGPKGPCAPVGTAPVMPTPKCPCEK